MVSVPYQADQFILSYLGLVCHHAAQAHRVEVGPGTEHLIVWQLGQLQCNRGEQVDGLRDHNEHRVRSEGGHLVHDGAHDGDVAMRVLQSRLA
jgi:hypothetical protein